VRNERVLYGRKCRSMNDDMGEEELCLDKILSTASIKI
jgi:hypothetical protein